MVSVRVPYSWMFCRMCWAYADWGSFFFMYLMCSLYLMDRQVGLAYVCFVAGSAMYFVDAAFVVVGCPITGSGSGSLLNSVCASEGYFDVCLFEKVGDFSDFIAVVCEGGPFFWFCCRDCLCEFFCCVCLSSLVMRWMGKLLFFAMVRIFCHSVSSLSAVRGSDVILLVR